MADGSMIFDFFSKVSKNSQERGAYINPSPQRKEPSPTQHSPSLEDIKKKNIEQLRQNAINPQPVAVQNSYDTPGTRPLAPTPAFPNSRTEERGIPDSANPISQAHAGIPSSPPPSPGNADLSAVFNYWKTKK